MKYELFIDFDGTITTVDTLEYLLNNFADNRWLEIEEKISRNEIPEVEGLQEQFKLINLSKEQALQVVDKVVEFDPYFKQLFQWCEQKGIPTVIVSGGFRWIISFLLKKKGLQEINLKSNDVSIINGKWEIIPGGSITECDKCNHCKTQYIRASKKQGYTTIYIGDGNTDRCPAKEADIVFAKGELEKFCHQEKMQFFPYRNLHEVYIRLKNIVE